MSQFNLEQALAQWKKSLRKYEGFEPGTTEELLSHVSDAIDDLVNQGYTEEKAFHKVTQEKIGDLEGLSREYYKAKSLDASSHSKRSSSLATNFIKVALRNIIKNRPHSYINLIGLAVGLASVIIISVYVFSELSYDKFHSDNQRIYRVLNHFVRGEAEITYPQAPPALAPALTSSFPEVELATRVRYADRPLIQYGDVTYYENHVFYADSSFLKIFDFELISGNRMRALNQPNSVIMSETIAKKYFGDNDPINKIILMDGVGPLQVTGILKDVPHNAHFYFEMLVSFQTYVVPDGYLADLQSWSWMGFLTYVKTHEGVSIPELEKKITNHYKASEERLAQQQMDVLLQPLNDIYLGSTSLGNPNNIFRVNSYTTIYSLMAIGFLIILIASFNYINLSIAMSMSRFKEIAMRKVLGSTKRKLILQFILESVLYAIVSLVIALALVMIGQTFLPQSITSKLSLDYPSLIIYSLALFTFVIFIGIISGVFPALRLSSISSLELLKGTFKLKEGHTRNFLIGFQFALSAALVAISLIIGQQIEFFTTKNLGFQKEGIVCINIGSDQAFGKTKGLQNQLKDNSNILSISQVSHIMGEGLSSSPLRLPMQAPEDAIQMNYFQTDYNFLPTMGLELVEGRYFSEEFTRDSTESIILNETAVKTLGLTEPLGKRVVFTGGTEREIIGIIKDFHFNSLHQAISPMAIIMPFTHLGQLAVRFQGDNMFNTLNNIESTWNESFPNVPFEFQFIDDHLASLYEKETFFASVIQFFTILATGIACLGLYSLAAISLAGKVKQISIRRVLGAPVQSIVLLTGKSFLSLVVIATIISWPLVWYVMNIWLSNFAYHIDISPWFFAITLGAILIITIVTISYHLFKAVTINPAETLRDN